MRGILPGMFPDQPLSENELDELDTFLAEEVGSDECMDISTLHGFLTALVVGPSLVMPGEWLPVVWGEGKSPHFASLEKANRILDLIMRLNNSISWTLQEGLEEFEPILLERTLPDGKVIPVAGPWCEGFMDGVSLRFNDWDPLSKDNESSILLLPVLAFSDPDTLVDFLALSKSQKMTPQDVIDMIPDAVAGLYHYWRERRKPRGTGITLESKRFARTSKVSRNDPCPCGSGKKYKKCCALRPQ